MENKPQNPEFRNNPVNFYPCYLVLVARKTCRRGVVNNKGADQPVHWRSLISAFVTCLLESIISRLARA